MKRRGFTLIELMVVIAIIIILAAIAIPNYLSMTARARKSRVASDFAAIATALETYRTDWNHYPIVASSSINTVSSALDLELIGVGGTENIATKTNANGETGGIQYMSSNILKGMVNPYGSANGDYTYTSTAVTGARWLLTVNTAASGTDTFLSRTDETTTLTGPSTALTISGS